MLTDAEKLSLAESENTKLMESERRAQFIQETLVICVRCRRWPVFYAFRGKCPEKGLCLTCWEETR